MSCPSALLSVSRLGAGVTGIIYGNYRRATLEGAVAKRAEERKAAGIHVAHADTIINNTANTTKSSISGIPPQ